MPKAVTKSNPSVPRLFVLELNAGCIHAMNTDGSERTTIVTGCHLPDGIVVDVEAGHIYWTNMGIPSLNDGSIERTDIDGKNRKTIVPQGHTHTPKAALCDAKFFGLHDRMHPANAAMNVYRAKDDTWFVLIITPDKVEAVAKAIGRPDLLTDPRFSDPAKLMTSMTELTAVLDQTFCSEPMSHWYEVFNGVHVTFGAVRGAQEVVNDPQLRANDIIVPLEGAGGKLTSTISSPMQVHGVTKVPAQRAPKIGEHNDEVLRQLGFSAAEIDGLHASGAVPKAKEHAA